MLHKNIKNAPYKFPLGMSHLQKRLIPHGIVKLNATVSNLFSLSHINHFKPMQLREKSF